MSSSPPENMEQDVDAPLNYGTTSGKDKRVTFATKFKAISVEKPPTTDPFNFVLAVMGLCCCLPASVCMFCCCCFGVVWQFVPIAEIIIGWLYYDPEYCPKEDIARLLIIGGSIGMLTGFIECCCGGRQIQQQQQLGKISSPENGGVLPTQPQRDTPICVKIVVWIMRIAALVWLGVSASVVYRFYGSVSYEEGDESYCHPLMYRFLFWVVSVSLAILVMAPLVVLCACCLGLCAAAGAAVD